MTDIGREQYLAAAAACYDEVGIGQRARSQGGVDLDVIAAGRERFPLGMRQAEPPAPCVIGGDIGNGVGLVWQRIEMLLQLGELDDLVHRLRIADNVQVVALKIDDAASRGVGNESVAN